MKRQTKNKTWGILPVALLTMVCSCSDGEKIDEPEVDQPAQPIVLTTRGAEAARQLTGFYPVLTQDVAALIDGENQSDNGNFVISPLSASIVLAMTGNAVGSELCDEITGYLGTEDLQGMNELASALLESLPGVDRKTTLALANSVWVNDIYTLNDTYAGLVSGTYNSDIDYFNAGKIEETISRINSWCSRNTDGMITGYMTGLNLNPMTKAVLLNAMNFRSEWRNEELFDANSTEKGVFNGRNGISEASMMKTGQRSMTGIVEDDYTYVMLPLGNGAFNFEVLMQGDETTEGLSGQLSEARKNADVYTKATLVMPKFKVEKELVLNDVLASKGLSHLGDVNDLTLFTTEERGLIQFRQKTLLEVDEKGAKAASVSSSEIQDTFMPDFSEPIEINIDRPFMFFITESSTGACVVSGRITDL